jgi:hypothetical protein
MSCGNVCELVRFDWSTMLELEGSSFITYSLHDKIIEDGNVRDSTIYRVVEGAVRVQLGELHWCIAALDYWPVFGTMNAFDTQKLYSLSVTVTSSPCKVQLISTAALIAFLFQGPQSYDKASLFFESMCRYFALQLKSAPQTTFFRSKSSVSRGCFALNGEIIIYSSKVSFYVRLWKTKFPEISLLILFFFFFFFFFFEGYSSNRPNNEII